jgi:threonine/homoserine/homoserine lactone efflux protein
MPTIELLLTFFATTALFAVMPGPAVIYTVARTIAAGRKAGLLAVAGLHLGCYVHVFAAAAGLSVLFHSVPSIYLTLKLAGAAYLIWLGIGLIRTRARTGEIELPEITLPTGNAFGQSILVEILNPKTAVFFVAFLPQFVDSTAVFPVWLQFVLLGTIVNIIFSISDLVYMSFAGIFVERLRQSGRMQRLAQRIGGTFLVGLGLHVALQRN